MGRHKSAKNCSISPWLSGRIDCVEKRFIQVGDTLLTSKRFQALNANAKYLYLCLAMESGGRPFTKLSHGSAERKYGIAPSTYDRAFRELITNSFIEQILDDDRSQFRTNEFRFSLAWKRDVFP